MKFQNANLKLEGNHVNRWIEEQIYAKKREKYLLKWTSHFQFFHWRRKCFIFLQREKRSGKLIFHYAFCSQSSIFHMRKKRKISIHNEDIWGLVSRSLHKSNLWSNLYQNCAHYMEVENWKLVRLLHSKMGFPPSIKPTIERWKRDLNWINTEW